MREAELPREIAEDVAERVEGRVLDGGWRRLTTGFVRELVTTEARRDGLRRSASAPGAGRSSRHDLRRCLRAGVPAGPRADEPALVAAGDLESALTRRSCAVMRSTTSWTSRAPRRTSRVISRSRIWAARTCRCPAPSRSSSCSRARRTLPRPLPHWRRIGNLLARTAHGLVLEEERAPARRAGRPRRANRRARRRAHALGGLAERAAARSTSVRRSDARRRCSRARWPSSRRARGPLGRA